MILVKGNNDEIWYVEVRCVLFVENLVKGYFYIKYRNWNENKLWIRESYLS